MCGAVRGEQSARMEEDGGSWTTMRHRHLGSWPDALVQVSAVTMRYDGS